MFGFDIKSHTSYILPQVPFTLKGVWRFVLWLGGCSVGPPCRCVRQLLCTGCGLGGDHLRLSQSRQGIAFIPMVRYNGFGTFCFRCSSGPLAASWVLCVPSACLLGGSGNASRNASFRAELGQGPRSVPLQLVYTLCTPCLHLVYNLSTPVYTLSTIC